MGTMKNVVDIIDEVLLEMKQNRERKDISFIEILTNETPFVQRLEDLSNALPDELIPGKMVSFQVADGYASYMIVRVGARDCVVRHIPYADCYHSSGEFKNKKGESIISTREIKRQLAWDFAMAKAFGKKG